MISTLKLKTQHQSTVRTHLEGLLLAIDYTELSRFWFKTGNHGPVLDMTQTHICQNLVVSWKQQLHRFEEQNYVLRIFST